jgi:hypothetical protein
VADFAHSGRILWGGLIVTLIAFVTWRDAGFDRSHASK